MSLPVHWVPSLTGLGPGDVIEVTGAEAHHAVAVRRLKVGEQVALTDGLGSRAVGEVSGTGKRLLSVTIGEVTITERPSPRFTVVQALPKGERGELAVEMLTEIGVDSIVPWAAFRSVAVWRGERAVKSHAKWSATAQEAAKQARRSWFPDVRELATTDEVRALLAEADVAVVLHEEAAAALTDVAPLAGHVMVVVGPEGGITSDELAAFSDLGATAVRLGSEVLRTSTAGVAAVSALMARTPRWQ